MDTAEGVCPCIHDQEIMFSPLPCSVTLVTFACPGCVSLSWLHLSMGIPFPFGARRSRAHPSSPRPNLMEPNTTERDGLNVTYKLGTQWGAHQAEESQGAEGGWKEWCLCLSEPLFFQEIVNSSARLRAARASQGRVPVLLSGHPGLGRHAPGNFMASPPLPCGLTLGPSPCLQHLQAHTTPRVWVDHFQRGLFLSSLGFPY